MIINNTSRNINTPKFCAGKIFFESDFDGTCMPFKFRHDAICRDGIVPLDKEAFKTYFKGFGDFIKKIMGKPEDPKFNFNIITGRNLPEYNYYLRKIREKNLSMPLPDSVTINNGGDQYLRVSNTGDFFQSSEHKAYKTENFNPKKREWVKKESNGWDGDEITKIAKNVILQSNDPNRQTNITRLGSFVTDKTGSELEETYDELMRANISKDELRNRIEGLAKSKIENATGQKEKDDTRWYIGEFVDELHQIKQKKFDIQEAETANIFYDKDMMLSEKLHSMNPPRFVAGFREDGGLGLHIAFSPSHNDNEMGALRETVKQIRDNLHSLLTQNGRKVCTEYCEADVSSIGTYGAKLPSIKILPQMPDGTPLDKLHHVKRQVQKVMQDDSNDLIIAAGDGPNDAKMLHFFEHLENQTAENFNDAESLKKIYDMPLISIFVDNTGKYSPIKNSAAGIPYHEIDNYFNSDGKIRFIHVDPTDPRKPQTLQDAIQLAIREYARRNEKFKQNLSPEMRETIEKMDYEYPVDTSVLKKLEQQK